MHSASEIPSEKSPICPDWPFGVLGCSVSTSDTSEKHDRESSGRLGDEVDVMILDLLKEDRIDATCNSYGEWVADCPVCSAKGKFIVHSDVEKWWCLKCEIEGDLIDYLCHFRGMTLGEATKFSQA